MYSKKKVAIIGTVGLPANYGGFETLTEHLVKNLHQEYALSVYCSGKKYPKHQRQDQYLGAKLHYLPLEANGIQSILYDTWSIIHALFYADVLLILGVAGAWMIPFVRLFTNKKVIISIDGIEWKRDKWNRLAKAFLFWSENIAVKYSHIDISDNESIQDYTALRYGSLSRIIEYGADHTLRVQPTKEHKNLFPFLKLPYAFKVCRIEPENNVGMVLEAFSKMPKYTLVMVGNWNNSAYGMALRAQFHAYPNLFLLDPIYDQQKLDTIRGNATVYIHGHSAGGTNPSLVEAMYLGLPVIAYGVSYNKTTTEQKALYFKTSDELISLIEGTKFADLKALGSVMANVAQRRYTWKRIAEQYRKLIVEALSISGKEKVIAKTQKIDYATLLQLNIGHLACQQGFYEKR
jgi:glycosyltransferase involved in cell wall biosynthesis